MNHSQLQQYLNITKVMSGAFVVASRQVLVNKVDPNRNGLKGVKHSPTIPTFLLMTDIKASASELAGGGAAVDGVFADVVGHGLDDSVDQAVQLGRFAFGDHLDAAVGHVFDVAGDGKIARDARGSISKANALNAAGEVDGVAGHVDYFYNKDTKNQLNRQEYKTIVFFLALSASWRFI
jgi:hypothetical protein